ncbi:uncharacterized protein METZ01_LOCUS171215 [marine metagenome]|uniref:Uncharacterized protein n=1 Tax=marine metagenome TaxID=408172 RepID=A0A382BXZ4_9ZZZZ
MDGESAPIYSTHKKPHESAKGGQAVGLFVK